MRAPIEYTFPRYLEAKRSVDDRALNRQVWDTLVGNLPASGPHAPLRVLEVGAGTGAMLERVLDWGLLGHAQYTGIDASAENIAEASRNLAARRSDREKQPPDRAIGLSQEGLDFNVTVELETIDVFEYIRRAAGTRQWDLLLAHAFLDLVDISTTLPQLFSLLRPGGLFYFTINFDGLTLLEPAIDPPFDVQIQDLYHRTMDERLTDGKPSGDSRAGRHLFSHLKEAGARILEAGASDWVVFPGSLGYPAGEAYFLHFIVQTIYQALNGHPELEVDRFERWIAARHAQIERCELTFIAHQLDFVGIWPGV